MQSLKTKPKLLFLYSELADYFIACIKKLVSVYDADVKVIHWPVNKEAPFVFDFPKGVNFSEKNNYNRQKIAEEIKLFSPDFIYCSGWMDKDYLHVIKNYKNKIPVVMGLDTWWNATPKQYIACLLSRVTLLHTFSHCWVPGNKQKAYARKLGFKNENILTGYYTADVDYYKAMGDNFSKQKRDEFPHRFIYAGRYYSFKGVTDLWDAFIAWKKESNNDWELWCLGTGDVKPVEHPAIKHFGFVQPKNMGKYMQETGVFIMPSRFEPWGVVLHEFCAAGFPLICSDKVGAAEAFLQPEQNGYIYAAENKNELKNCMNKIANLQHSELLAMGQVSSKTALKITTTLWAETLIKTV